jgi:hypothetical protein
MTRITRALPVIAALLALGACGHHDQARDEATQNSVEMPAADLPASPPSMDAPPPAHDPEADASRAAETARDTATNDAANAASVAQAARDAANEAEQQQNGNTTPTPAQ